MVQVDLHKIDFVGTCKSIISLHKIVYVKTEHKYTTELYNGSIISFLNIYLLVRNMCARIPYFQITN